LNANHRDAKIVPDRNVLKSYPYCGHPALAGIGKKKRAWQDCEYVLGYFGKMVRKARREYLSYMEAGVGHEDWGLLLTLTNIPYESRADDSMDFSKGNPFSDFLPFRV
jgi:hypothetical protein